MCWPSGVAVRKTGLGCLERGVVLSWLRGARLCGMGAWIPRPRFVGPPHWRDGHYGVRRSLGHGGGDRCTTVQWPGLIARTLDFRWESNVDRDAGIENGGLAHPSASSLLRLRHPFDCAQGRPLPLLQGWEPPTSMSLKFLVSDFSPLGIEVRSTHPSNSAKGAASAWKVPNTYGQRVGQRPGIRPKSRRGGHRGNHGSCSEALRPRALN
jgi:hypothetical protein